MERTIGIEPILPASKTGALSIGRHAHIKQDTFSFQSYSLNLLNFAVCILKPQDVAVGVEPTREPRGHSRSPITDSTFTNSVTLSETGATCPMRYDSVESFSHSYSYGGEMNFVPR